MDGATKSKVEDSTTHKSPNLKVEVDDVKKTIQDKASSMMEDGKTEAKAYAETAQRKTKSALADKKEQAVGELGNLAQAFRQTGSQLRHGDQSAVAQYTDKAANQIERMSEYLSNRDVDQLIGEGEALARRNPELFLGVTFGLGLLAARFIKSSRQRRESNSRQTQFESRT